MRNNKQWLGIALASLIVSWPSAGWSAGNDAPTDSFYRLMREAAMALLKEGNIRFATGHSTYPNTDAERRHNTVAEGQQPFATVLACSDSRDPVEQIFDRGIGDLLVVRVAGNVAGLSELATIEFGVSHLNTPLLVVMGHTKCETISAVAMGAELHGFFQKLAEKIVPAVNRAKDVATSPEDIVPRAIEGNIWQVISDILRQSTEIREQVLKGRLQIVGALYDLDSGTVKWLGVHPEQKALLSLSPPPSEKPRSSPPSKVPPPAPVAKVAPEITAPTLPKPAAAIKPPPEPPGTINSTPGLDIDFGTSSVLPSSKKKGV